MSGQVYAHVGQPFREAHYDLLIIGAGRMGAALARFIMEQQPQTRLLLAEEGGLPNEEGATILAPGVWHSFVPPEQAQRAADTRDLLAEALTVCGVLDLSADEGGGQVPTDAVWTPELAALVDPAALPVARFDEHGGVYSVASSTLQNAQAAVKAGADLMLNVRCELTGNGHVLLQRLSVTNTHEIVVEQRVSVQADTVVIAAGAAGPPLIEAGLGRVTPHRQAYRQSVRLNLPSTQSSRVVQAGGFILRPQSGGYTVVPPILHPDPCGYTPSGGRLAGVPVGLRREVIESMLDVLDALPALADERLVVGRSIADIPGAWLALPAGGWPLWERLDEQHLLLLGGERADLTGLSVAHELAGELAQARRG
ncbi:FAD-binding oxidoreductase [Deinococcus sp. KNUC1210]|uniref:FAD-dependent oxidoreductase n=1 Tax=Deinococcus sp. KNUC1210 TaxID=2917691 RepID=UPI001EF14637|nr:FAD-dependent oxidoreductase [Deinococcus sp. KNUC1210]ULH14732.1 FAD-binding oxidoreductase [Deinococcus sp. KNUC1210]